MGTKGVPETNLVQDDAWGQLIPRSKRSAARGMLGIAKAKDLFLGIWNGRKGCRHEETYQITVAREKPHCLVWVCNRRNREGTHRFTLTLDEARQHVMWGRTFFMDLRELSDSLETDRTPTVKWY